MIKFLIIIYVSLMLLSCATSKKDILNFKSKVQIIKDIPGNGLAVQNHYKITSHYKGFLENGTEFDSTYKINKPFTFQIGLRQVIEGWELGLNGMKVGGKRTIKIPPNLAYGKKGVKNLIPSNSTLIFEIEIIDIQPHSYILLNSSNLKYLLNEKLFKLQNINFIIVDIRTSNQIKASGFIKNSYKINAFDINGNLNKEFVNNLKSSIKNNTHVVLVSEDGEVSSILANGLIENIGMKNIYSLKEGINGWVNKGYEIKKL
mgnify:CR=1 FL=1